MAGRKTATKTAGKPFQKGADPRRGVGKAGRSGRTPDEFKRMCQELASSEAVRLNVLNILASPADYPGLYVGALKWATEHGYGKPKESVDMKVEGELTLKQEWTFGNRKVGF